MADIVNNNFVRLKRHNKECSDLLDYIDKNYPNAVKKENNKIVEINIEIDIQESRFTNLTCEGISFKQKVSFNNCKFTDKVSFKNCTFEKQVTFSNSLFGNKVYFDNSIFKDYVDFHESNFMNITSFYGVKFQKVPNFSACYFKEQKALNLVNVDINSLDFSKVKKFIDDNYRDKTYEKDIKQNLNKRNEIEQKHQLRYAQNIKDSFRVIKDTLIEQNNILEAQEWHKFELYAKENELAINFMLKRISKNANLYKNILIWFNCIMLQFYRITSDHHTNFISIFNFTIGVIALYGAFCSLLFGFGSNCKLTVITLCYIALVCVAILYFCMKEKTIINFLFVMLLCCIFLIYWFINIIDKNVVLFYYFIIFISSIFFYCVLFAWTNPIFVYLMRFFLYLGFLWVLFSFPQLINPFIGIFPSDKIIQSKFERKLSDLNSSTIINLAKISQKDFALQNDYNVSFAELNSAKMIVLSNKYNITALEDDNLNKITQILGTNLYDEISYIISQDKILSEIIKSTSVIYSIILLLCIFSLQKTARKNSIIPS